MTASPLLRYLNRFRGRRIAVLGDFMLDHFIWGRASRLSAEAPVPVVETSGESFLPGGAGNVVANLAALGARAIPFGMVGRDLSGRILRRELARRGVLAGTLLTTSDRPTTRKLRIIETARKHQVARADLERCEPAPSRIVRRLVSSMLTGNFHAVIVSDYDKGTVTPELLKQVLPALVRSGTPVFLDPRPRQAVHYRPVTVLTPNRHEAELISGVPIRDAFTLRMAARRILAQTEGAAVLITLGHEGMALMEKGGRLHNVPTQAREIYDVTGAGDTVISVLALAYAAGAPLPAAAALANYAAGIVVGRVGTVVPTLAELRAALRAPGRK